MEFNSRKFIAFMIGLWQVHAYPYCLFFDNSASVGNISLPVVIFSSAKDWKSLDASKEITKKIFESLKETGAAISGDKESSDTVQQLANTIEKLAKTAESEGTTEIIGTAVQVLAEPLNIAVDEIVKAAVQKRTHFLTQGTTRDCWDWKDIEANGIDTNKTVFGVVLDQTDQSYLGTFQVDTRGEVHIKIDPNDKSLYLQIWNYDDSVPNTNLKKVFETVGWDTVGMKKTSK